MVEFKPATTPFGHSSRRLMYLDFKPTAIYVPPHVITHYDNLLLRVDSVLYKNGVSSFAMYSSTHQQVIDIIRFTIEL